MACGDDDAATASDGGMADARPADSSLGNRDASDPDAATDAAIVEPCDGPPGLYADADCTELADDVQFYAPRYVLWSDGADKERYVSIPEGEQIDTSDPDEWVYPVGTRFWKTFLIDDMRVETRYFEKTSPATGVPGWSIRTFRWNAEQDEVEEVFDGEQNVLSTNHDIPPLNECNECHQNRTDIVASFTAIQLNHDDAEVSLGDLLRDDLLTDAIALSDAEIPGTASEQEALGYLHANCGNCHGTGIRRRPTPMVLWVNTGLSSVQETGTYSTAVDQPVTGMPSMTLIEPGEPDMSFVVARISSRENGVQMPPIGTEVVHSDGVTLIRNWISGL